MSVRNRTEKGATAVIVAGSLIMIMGIAAIAIDGGQAFSERRQAQTGVDFAAMAALQSAISCPSPCTPAAAANAGAAEAQAVVAENLPGRALNWAACTDPSRPAKFSRVASTTPCISFTSSFDEARVVLPNDVIGTSFGGVVGQPTVSISAFAEAGQQSTASASVLPFAYSSGSHICIWSNSAPQSTPPCGGPSAGNFGALDIYVYGNPALGTTRNCSGGAGPRIQSNLAIGTDHILSSWTSGDPIVNDQDACPNLSESPNQIEVQTGFGLTSEITSGLITNANARLRCELGVSSSCIMLRGERLDNTPLWHYLLPGACSGPTPSTRSEMESCLNGWTGGVIFEEAIKENPRFAAVPLLPSYPGSGFGNHLITGFQPVYIETVIAGNCTANTCALVFSPGESSTLPTCPSPLGTVAACGYSPGSTWGGNRRVQSLTAFSLPLGMLPASIRDTFPGEVGVRTFALTE